MLRKQFQPPALSHGLSLIELMIALVAGLIVSGAALALVVSIMKSNADTIRATRLTQELRTTAEIMARDLRRARGVTDPIVNVGIATASMLKACNAITPVSGASASCVTFGYDCTGATVGTFHAIGVAGGKVRMAASTSAVPACPTAGTGTQLSSDIITITGLNISAFNDAYTIRLSGRFTNDPSATPLSRSITQEVRVRSAAVN
jgi:type IV pilus assembly protein PilW